MATANPNTANPKSRHSCRTLLSKCRLESGNPLDSARETPSCSVMFGAGQVQLGSGKPTECCSYMCLVDSQTKIYQQALKAKPSALLAQVGSSHSGTFAVVARIGKLSTC